MLTMHVLNTQRNSLGVQHKPLSLSAYHAGQTAELRDTIQLATGSGHVSAAARAAVQMLGQRSRVAGVCMV